MKNIRKSYFKIGLLLFALMLVLMACSSENGQVKYKEYEFSADGVPTFSFDYPEDWFIKESLPRKATEKVEASPEWGAEIYQEGNDQDSVYIFGSFSIRSHVDDEENLKEDFIVDGVKIGTSYTDTLEGRVNIYILYDKETEEGWQNAFVDMEEDFYNDNKEAVWHILGSVDY